MSNRPPGRHRIQNVEGPVLDPCAKQTYFRRGPKVDPLRIESGPSWRVCFWPLRFVRCAEALQAPMCTKCQAWSYFNTNSIRGWNLELGRPVFARLVFLASLGPKNRPFFVTGRSKSRANATSWTPELAQGARDRPQNKDESASFCKAKALYEAASLQFAGSVCVCRYCKE